MLIPKSTTDIGLDTDQPDQRDGRVLARSPAGLLYGNQDQSRRLSEFSLGAYQASSSGVVECVSIDTPRNKAYFSVGHVLNEVDLQTLQLTAQHKFAAPISVLSKANYPTPMTVGTTLSLYLHDPRIQRNASSSSSMPRLEALDTMVGVFGASVTPFRRYINYGITSARIHVGNFSMFDIC